MRVLACAKVNLALGVTGRRADGYHELSTLMHTVGDLYDIVDVEPHEGVDVGFDSRGSGIPRDNTVTRAVEAFMRASGCPGARVRVAKRIPERAGLGGGSADAGAVLRALSAMYGGVSEAEMLRIAESIGADVPFAYAGGAALCTGKGERMARLEHRHLPLLIVKAAGGISTAELFGRLTLPAMPVDSAAAASAYERGALIELAWAMRNALEPLAAALEPDIAALKEELFECGAIGACMTGSGSAVVGLFPDFDAVSQARSAMAGHSFVHACRAVVPVQ
ncbi:MAG: 4-(cytidine 5'-diphospho)-2-C-methyl-D-erythritol kinase [Clostridia bacterium]|nr:4-(cytidine 5'-diphospho)-2-C-methyl-D-erythritol kinase [Clostridia bacterium]